MGLQDFMDNCKDMISGEEEKPLKEETVDCPKCAAILEAVRKIYG